MIKLFVIIKIDVQIHACFVIIKKKKKIIESSFDDNDNKTSMKDVYSPWKKELYEKKTNIYERSEKKKQRRK